MVAFMVQSFLTIKGLVSGSIDFYLTLCSTLVGLKVLFNALKTFTLFIKVPERSSESDSKTVELKYSVLAMTGLKFK